MFTYIFTKSKKSWSSPARAGLPGFFWLVIFFAAILALVQPAYAQEFTSCPVDGGSGDDDGVANGTITINQSTYIWKADALNRGVIDCAGKNVVINSAVIFQPYIATHDGNTADDYAVHLKANNIMVSANGVLNSDYRGYRGGDGPGAAATANSAGGGSHGGKGGCGAFRSISCGLNAYGSSADPVSLGSGGGDGQYRSLVEGGFGGGGIILEGGNVRIDGRISVKGADGSGTWGKYRQNTASGGGSGGTVKIVASGSLSGNGLITARGGNGGNYGDYHGGGGSGGRVAFYFGNYDSAAWSLDDNVDVRGGGAQAAATFGADGTAIFVQNGVDGESARINDNYEFLLSDSDNGVFYFENLLLEDGASVFLNEFSGQIVTFDIKNDFVLHGSSFICGKGQQKGIIFKIGGDLEIDGASVLSCDGNGYPDATGPGHGTNSYAGGGGSYGGFGTNGKASQAGKRGEIYGSAIDPADFGSAGGTGQYRELASGGSGGGLIRIAVSGDALVDGLISMNGMNGTGKAAKYGDNSASGGGSGGSGKLEVLGVLKGNGQLLANGGDGGLITNYFGGGGSGGRLAIFYNSAQSGTTIDGLKDSAAWGGNLGDGSQKAENGTVAFFDTATNPFSLSVFNQQRYEFLDDDSADGIFAFHDIYFENAGVRVQGLGTEKKIIADNLNVLDSSWVVAASTTFNVSRNISFEHSGNNTTVLYTDGPERTVVIDAVGEFFLSENSSIKVDGSGYGAKEGPSPGLTANSGGGGGYGGRGQQGIGGTKGDGGMQNGSTVMPADFGSGGGDGVNRPTVEGGRGGGILKITVGGPAHIHGLLSANGGNGAAQWGTYGDNATSGGGAGGTIFLDFKNSLDGNGLITADGGNGGAINNFNGGGGGGGRIAINYLAMPGVTIDGLKDATALGGWRGDNAEQAEIGTVAFFDQSVSPPRVAAYNGQRYEFMDSDATGDAYSFSDIYFEEALVRVEAKGNNKTINVSNTLETRAADWLFEKGVSFNVGGNVIAGDFNGKGSLWHGQRSIAPMRFNVGTDFVIEALSHIALDGMGYNSAAGPGAGGQANSGGGAGHGGVGAKGQGGSAGNGGAIYDDEKKPIDYGSGGGTGKNRPTVQGGRGGGLFELIAGNRTTINGKITANGMAGSQQAGSYGDHAASGGGAGGSIYIESLYLGGDGMVAAHGGNGGKITSFNGGAGGGGRIAMCYYQAEGSFLNGCEADVSNGCGNVSVLPGSGGIGATNGTFYNGTECLPPPEPIGNGDGDGDADANPPIFYDDPAGEESEEIRSLSCSKLNGIPEEWNLSSGAGRFNFDALTGSAQSLSTCIYLNESFKEQIIPAGDDDYSGSGQVMEGWTWNTNVGWISFSCQDFENLLQNSTFCERSSRYQVYRDDQGFLRGYAWGTKVGWVWFNWGDGCPGCAGSADGKDYRPRMDEVIDNPGTPDHGKAFLHGYAWSPRVGYISLENAYVEPRCENDECIIPPEIVPDMERSFVCSKEQDSTYSYGPRLVQGTGTPVVLWDARKLSGEPPMTFNQTAPELNVLISKEYCAAIPEAESQKMELEVRARNNHTQDGGWGNLGGEDLKRWTLSIMNTCVQPATIACAPVPPATEVTQAWIGKHYEVECEAKFDELTTPTPPLNWKLEGAVPQGMTHAGVDSDSGLKRRILWDPPRQGLGTDYFLKLSAQNACGVGRYQYILKLNAQKPDIVSSCPKSVVHNAQEYVYQPQVSGATPIKFSIVTGEKIEKVADESGFELLIDPDTGRISNWRSPDIGDLKKDEGYGFALRVDNQYGSASESCEFSVVDEAEAPIIDSASKLNGALQYYAYGDNGGVFQQQYRLKGGTLPIDWHFEGDLVGSATLVDGQFKWQIAQQDYASFEGRRKEVSTLYAYNAASQPSQDYFWLDETRSWASADHFTVVPGFKPEITISEIPQEHSALYKTPTENIFQIVCRANNNETDFSTMQVIGTVDDLNGQPVSNACKRYKLRLLDPPEGEVVLDDDGKIHWRGNGPDELRDYTFTLEASNGWGTVSRPVKLHVRNIPELAVPDSECEDGSSLSVPVQVISEPPLLAQPYGMGFEPGGSQPARMIVGKFGIKYEVRWLSCAHPSGGPSDADGVNSTYNLRLWGDNGFGGVGNLGYSNLFKVKVVPQQNRQLEIQEQRVFVEEQNPKQYRLGLTAEKEGNGPVSFSVIRFYNSSSGADVEAADYAIAPAGTKNAIFSWLRNVPAYDTDNPSLNEFSLELRAIDAGGQEDLATVILQIVPFGSRGGEQELWSEKVFSDIKGAVSVQKQVLETKEGQKSFNNLGDVAASLNRDVFYANVISLIKGARSGNADRLQPASLAGIKPSVDGKSLEVLNNLAGVSLGGSELLYFEQENVRIYDPTKNISECQMNWTGKQTIIVNRGNLYIDCNLWSEEGGSLDIVVLGKLEKPKDFGNIYVDHRVTNLGEVHVYTDGSIFRYSASPENDPLNENPDLDKRTIEKDVPKFYDTINNGRGCFAMELDANSDGEIDFNEFAQCMDDYLPNQFIIKGSLNARNSIGGVKFDNNGFFKEKMIDGYGNETQKVLEAAPYDLNLMSFYHLNFDARDCDLSVPEAADYNADGSSYVCNDLDNLRIEDQVLKRIIGRWATGVADPYCNDSGNAADCAQLDSGDPIFDANYLRLPVIFQYAPPGTDSKVFKLLD